ncbi:UVR8, partial [Symbiodinium pilosum]
WTHRVSCQRVAFSRVWHILFEVLRHWKSEVTVMLALGQQHSLACADGDIVLAWGDNHRGQFGDGKRTSRPTPEKVFDADFVGLAAGMQHSMGLTQTGRLLCWGGNEFGQLGDGTIRPRLEPVEVELPGIKQISAGWWHSLAVTGSGEVWTWGQNKQGQLGDGTQETRMSPVRVASGVRQAAAGWLHSCAVTESGQVLIWGTLDGVTYPEMTEVADSSYGAVAVDCGYAHTAFRTRDGQVFALGANARGQLGNGSTDAFALPVRAQTTAVSGSPVCALACGYEHTVALTDAGEVLTWGANDLGQLGDASAEDRRVPQRVFQQNDCVGIAAGWHHTACWACERGEVWVWGSNLEGQVGDGTKECALSPHRVLRQYPLLMHPSRLAVSFLQLIDFQEKVREESRITYPVMTVREVVHQVVRPATASQPNLGYARFLNSTRPLSGEAFISHGWDGPFVAFVEAVVEVFSSWQKPPNLWISFLALSVHVLVPLRFRREPPEAPWALALRRAKIVLLVRNRRCDVYKRLWCVFELFVASSLGFLSRPGGLLVHGANHPATERVVKLSGCQTSVPEDKEWLLSYFDQHPGSAEQAERVASHVHKTFYR